MFKWIFLSLVMAVPALARDFSDRSWPCIQRKVDRLSYGIVWPEVIDAGTLAPEANALAQKLALRRVSLEEAADLIMQYRDGGADRQSYGLVFLEAFARMDRDRTRLVRGIERYSLSQVGLSAKIADIRSDMDREMTKSDPDFDRLDLLEESLDWNARIFKDRQSVLTYVCESPVLLEKRIFAIGKLLLEARGE